MNVSRETSTENGRMPPINPEAVSFRAWARWDSVDLWRAFRMWDEGKTSAEIGEKLGRTPGAVRLKLMRSRRVA